MPDSIYKQVQCMTRGMYEYILNHAWTLDNGLDFWWDGSHHTIALATGFDLGEWDDD